MTRIKNQTSFQKDGYKRVFCDNCGRFITQSFLGEKKIRIRRCRKCKAIKTVYPPTKKVRNGITGVYWGGPEPAIWTATPELN